MFSLLIARALIVASFTNDVLSPLKFLFVIVISAFTFPESIVFAVSKEYLTV